MTTTIPDALVTFSGNLCAAFLLAFGIAALVYVIRDSWQVRIIRDKDDTISGLRRKAIDLVTELEGLKQGVATARCSAEVKEKENGDLRKRIDDAMDILDPPDKADGDEDGCDDDDENRDEADEPATPPVGGIYACSLMAQNTGTVSHCGFLVRAVSQDEAYGKAHRVGKKKYPTEEYEDGFKIIVTDALVDPEKLK